MHPSRSLPSVRGGAAGGEDDHFGRPRHQGRVHQPGTGSTSPGLCGGCVGCSPRRDPWRSPRQRTSPAACQSRREQQSTRPWTPRRGGSACGGRPNVSSSVASGNQRSSSAMLRTSAVHEPYCETLSHSPSWLSGLPLRPTTSTVLEPPGARHRSATALISGAGHSRIVRKRKPCDGCLNLRISEPWQVLSQLRQDGRPSTAAGLSHAQPEHRGRRYGTRRTGWSSPAKLPPATGPRAECPQPGARSVWR